MKQDVTLKMSPMKWVISTGLAMVIGLISVILFGNIQTDRVIALVNGEPISELEFKMELVQKRAYVYDYFQRKYRVVDGRNFWNTNYGGEVPIKVAREKALNECVKIKLQQRLAKEKGIVQDISYQGFLKAFKIENARRKEAVKQGRPVYGPQQYDESGYYRYLFHNMMIQLKEKLAENELQITEDQVRMYYEQNKAQNYRKEDAITLQKLTIPLSPQGTGTRNREDALTIMEQFRNRLLQGADLKETARNAQLKSPLQLNYSVQVMDNKTGRVDSRNNPILRDMACKTGVGQVSPVFEENNALNVIKCIAKKSGSYLDFHEFRDVIKSHLISQKYEQLVTELVKKAKVEIREKVYQRISFSP